MARAESGQVVGGGSSTGAVGDEQPPASCPGVSPVPVGGRFRGERYAHGRGGDRVAAAAGFDKAAIDGYAVRSANSWGRRGGRGGVRWVANPGRRGNRAPAPGQPCAVGGRAADTRRHVVPVTPHRRRHGKLRARATCRRRRSSGRGGGRAARRHRQCAATPSRGAQVGMWRGRRTRCGAPAARVSVVVRRRAGRRGPRRGGQIPDGLLARALAAAREAGASRAAPGARAR